MTTQQSDAPRVLCEVRRQAPTPPPVEAIVLTLPPDVAVTLRHLLGCATGHSSTTYARHAQDIYSALLEALAQADGWRACGALRFVGTVSAIPLPPEPAR